MLDTVVDGQNMRRLWRKKLCVCSLFLVAMCFGTTIVLTWIHLNNLRKGEEESDKLPCGDWTPYRNHECILLVDDAGAQTKKDAETICQALAKNGDEGNIPRLVTIKTKDKQEFLQEHLFTSEATFDNVWLGLELVNGKEFRWNDGTDMFYTNFAEKGGNNNQERGCVQMVPGDPSIFGRWVKVGCKKRNAVVCERTQSVSVSGLQNLLMNLKLEIEKNKHDYEDMLASSRRDSTQKIAADIKKVMDTVNAIKKEFEQKLVAVKQEGQKAVNSVKEEATKRATTNKGFIEKMINDVKQDTVKSVAAYKKEAEKWLNIIKKETEKRIAEAKSSSVPLGFIYIQLPGQDDPTLLWPHTTWTNISATYEGLFLRVKGGNAAPFGQIQEENSPRLLYVDSQKTDVEGSSRAVHIPQNGEWSGFVFTGDLDGNNDMKVRFQHSKGEVRPRNIAIVIWKRTG